ncbi:MAG: serine hydrolase [Fimbriimonadaceae bacterium]|nr:serine hydrolase [Fimbriimonadaceae bacterium]
MTLTVLQTKSIDLDLACRETVAAAAKAFPDEKLAEGDVAVTVHHLDPKTKTWAHGDYHGADSMYPASVIKFFYLVFAAHQLEQGKLKLSDEAARAVHDMIVDSNNDATGYVVDWLCGTTPGPELPPDELKKWVAKRQAVNNWYKSLHYTGVNACNRTFNEGPYGRESQILGEKLENRNSLNPNACARLMSELMLGKIVGPERTAWALKVLKRDVPADKADTDGQARGFTGAVLPKGSTLYSKAGWVDSNRHDVAGVVFPDGQEWVVAVFTKRGKNVKLVSWVVGDLFKRLGLPTVTPAPYEADPD